MPQLSTMSSVHTVFKFSKRTVNYSCVPNIKSGLLNSHWQYGSSESVVSEEVTVLLLQSITPIKTIKKFRWYNVSTRKKL